MRASSATFLSVLLLAANATSQTLDEYLALRKRNGITRAVGIPALEAFVGARTIEVQGVVKGSMSLSGDKRVLLLERSDGDYLQIRASKPPDWLLGNAVPARLIVHAERAEGVDELTAWLLGAAPEHEIARIEAEERRKQEARKRPNALSKPPPKGASKDWSLPVDQATAYYASFIKGRNKRLTDKQAWDIAKGISEFSVRYGVDARLILAMVMVESGFNPFATSRAGAQGLGQLMPGTAAGMGITNAYDTFQNLYGTVRAIRGHIDRYSDKTDDKYFALVLALAAYNAGSGAVSRHGGVPPYRETQAYIRKVVDVYSRFCGLK